MLTIQTNYASLVAQNNLQVNSNFQTKTIEQITSGYRINSAGDDAAGLAVANGYRDQISELTQGVQNANDGISSLQIIDGGLNNISTMLDRMQTLATESASSTFTGNRNTLNNEYQQLIGEITRQASDIGLVTGGANSANMSVFIGGGPTNGALALSQVGIALGGVSVDSTGLGLTNTSVAGADQGVTFTGAGDVRTGTFLATTAASVRGPHGQRDVHGRHRRHRNRAIGHCAGRFAEPAAPGERRGGGHQLHERRSRVQWKRLLHHQHGRRGFHRDGGRDHNQQHDVQPERPRMGGHRRYRVSEPDLHHRRQPDRRGPRCRRHHRRCGQRHQPGHELPGHLCFPG